MLGSVRPSNFCTIEGLSCVNGERLLIISISLTDFFDSYQCSFFQIAV